MVTMLRIAGEIAASYARVSPPRPFFGAGVSGACHMLFAYWNPDRTRLAQAFYERVEPGWGAFTDLGPHVRRPFAL